MVRLNRKIFLGIALLIFISDLNSIQSEEIIANNLNCSNSQLNEIYFPPSIECQIRLLRDRCTDVDNCLIGCLLTGNPLQRGNECFHFCKISHSTFINKNGKKIWRPPNKWGSCIRLERLIQKLRDDEPEEKMEAAEFLARLGNIIAVPYLFFEAKDNYPNFNCPKISCGFSHSDCDTSVIVNGEKRPYVDYHAPIYKALGILAIRFFSPDSKWFEEIEDWIRKNNLGKTLEHLRETKKQEN